MSKTAWMQEKDCNPPQHNEDVQTLELYERDLTRTLDEYPVMDGYRDHLLVELARTRKEIRERGNGGPLV
jgi:hypothetical protein